MQAEIDTAEALNDLLSQWHHWCSGYQLNPQSGADPMFRNAKSPKQWDSLGDVTDAEIHQKTMKAVQFHVWELQDPYRSAICILARNLYTGRSVWLNPRLPTDPIKRGEVVAEARRQLTKKLQAAGVI